MCTTVELNIAQANKKDEFYTQLVDIEAELHFYKHHFKDKVVYCNCDNPKTSNFVKFFIQHFLDYGLKELICSCIETENSPALYMRYAGKGDLVVQHMNGTGDFRSSESTDLLLQSDIVVTNPPFSLFRDFIDQLFEYEKDFLIIGNVNAVSYKECFKHILNKEMWLGQSIHSGDREFRVPDDYPLEAAGFRVDEKGTKYIRVKGVRWFTNMISEGEYGWLSLTEVYTPERYPKFDNIDAINVGKTKDIPLDYEGVMGVPITFMDFYNPNQFQLVGNEYTLKIAGGRGYINGKRKYSRIFIRRINSQETQGLGVC